LRDKVSKRSDVQILAIDPHETWSARHLLKETGFSEQDVAFPLLEDAAHTVSATYGVAFQMRIHTEWSNRPATFVIDREGVIRSAHVGERFNDRPTSKAIIEQLDRLAR